SLVFSGYHLRVSRPAATVSLQANHPSIATKCFVCHTSGNSRCNPFICHTSKIPPSQVLYLPHLRDPPPGSPETPLGPRGNSIGPVMEASFAYDLQLKTINLRLPPAANLAPVFPPVPSAHCCP